MELLNDANSDVTLFCTTPDIKKLYPSSLEKVHRYLKMKILSIFDIIYKLLFHADFLDFGSDGLSAIS